MYRITRYFLWLPGAIFLVACNAVESESEGMSPPPTREKNAVEADVGDAPFVREAEKILQLDFNGDGVGDHAYLLSGVSLNDAMFENAIRLDLWAADTEQNPTIAEKKRRVILVHLSNDTNMTKLFFILFSEGYASFLESVSDDDITAIHRENLLADYPELADTSRGDALSILTEAGIDTFVYWNGERFEFYEPEEIP